MIRNMTLDQHKGLAMKYIDPDKMYYVIAGDAKTQFEKVKSLGFDEVYLLNADGEVIENAEAMVMAAK